MKQVLSIFALSLISISQCFAGGKEKEVLTLSKGRYVEVFDQDSVEQIGNILYNVNSRQIVGFVTEEEIDNAASLQPEVISRWMQIDPHAENYYNISPYAFAANNPVVFKDPDGKDIVYFNRMGEEAYRVASTTQYQTFIMANNNASADPSRSTAGWKEVPMPNIIPSKGGEATDGAAYQANDYVIAARVGYFNQGKNAGLLNLVTEGGNPIPNDAQSSIPDLDPTLVKAMTIQESNAGVTGIKDIMQVNVAGDWATGAELKSKYNLTKGETMTVTKSLYSGIRVLTTKGFKNGITYDKKTGQSTYTFQGWDKAIDNYNSEQGTAGYKESVLKMQQNSRTPTPKDYQQ